MFWLCCTNADVKPVPVELQHLRISFITGLHYAKVPSMDSAAQQRCEYIKAAFLICQLSTSRMGSWNLQTSVFFLDTSSIELFDWFTRS